MNETLTAVFSRVRGNAPQIVVFDPDSTLIDQLRSRLQRPWVTLHQIPPERAAGIIDRTYRKYFGE